MKYFLRYTTGIWGIKDYRIGIVAVDSGNPVLSSTNSLKVQVTYMNDNSLVFSSTLYAIDFAEENQPGDNNLDVVATDTDNGSNAKLTSNITGGSVPKELFVINSNTAEVRVTSKLDRKLSASRVTTSLQLQTRKSIHIESVCNA